MKSGDGSPGLRCAPSGLRTGPACRLSQKDERDGLGPGPGLIYSWRRTVN